MENIWNFVQYYIANKPIFCLVVVQQRKQRLKKKHIFYRSILKQTRVLTKIEPRLKQDSNRNL